MNNYVLSPAARADLIDIWDYTITTWSNDQVERYIRQIQDSIELIASNPDIGFNCDFIRILHGRMDFQRHL
jgi:toxin ParE1/3/4